MGRHEMLRARYLIRLTGADRGSVVVTANDFESTAARVRILIAWG